MTDFKVCPILTNHKPQPDSSPIEGKLKALGNEYEMTLGLALALEKSENSDSEAQFFGNGGCSNYNDEEEVGEISLQVPPLPNSNQNCPSETDPPLSNLPEQQSETTDCDIDINYEEEYWSQNGASLGVEVDSESTELASTVRAIALRLEGALRAAKTAHLQTSEVLLPPDLLTRISRDIVRLAETEPCGVRGCLILLDFESGVPSPGTGAAAAGPSARTSPTPPNPHSTNNNLNNNNNNSNTVNNNVHGLNSSSSISDSAAANKRKIGKVKCDSHTVTTFELHLSLRGDLAPWYWYPRLPQILRNLIKGGTIIVSPAYTLTKKKLYRSH